MIIGVLQAATLVRIHPNDSCTSEADGRPIYTTRPLPPFANRSMSVSTPAVSCLCGLHQGNRQLSHLANTCSRPKADNLPFLEFAYSFSNLNSFSQGQY